MSESLGDTGEGVSKMSCTFQGCEGEVLAKCKNCHLDYCLDHGSEVDPARYCVNCLQPADAEVEIKPLVDSDGVAHTGRIIHPSGKGYRLAIKMVGEMSDDELKLFITEEKSRVADIEKIREYHHITLGMAESELYQRQLSPFSEVGGVLKVGTSRQTLPRNVKARRTGDSKPKTSKVDKIATMLGDLGLSAAGLVALLNQKGKK